MFLRVPDYFLLSELKKKKHGEAAFRHYATHRKAVAPTPSKSRLKTSLFDAAFDVKSDFDSS